MLRPARRRQRPVLLQTSVGANYRGGIQLTNPSADRNPDAKVHPIDELVGRTIGISRERLIGATACPSGSGSSTTPATPADVPVELELGADGADIFEVRGYPRPGAGRLLPVAVTDRRVTFRYDGLDDVERLTHLAFSEPAEAVEPDRRPAARRLADTGAVGPPALDADAGSGRDARAAAGRSGAPTGRPAGRPRRSTPPTRRSPAACSRRCRASRPTRARPRTTPGSAGRRRSSATTSCSTSSSSGPCPTCACSSTTARRPDQRYVAAGVPWFATLFGRDSLISAFQALAFRPQLAVETLDVLAAYQATEDDAFRDAEPGKILHELRTGEMARTGRAAAHAVLRLGRLDAAVADPARRDVRLDRRPRPGRPAVAERARRARLDRHVRRPRRRRVRRVRAALRARPPQPGLEGLERRDPRPDRPRGGAADRPRRGPGLRLRRQAAHGRARPDARRDGRWRPGSRPRPTTLADAVRGGVLDRGPALLRDGARRRQAPGRRDRAATPGSACGRASSRRSAPATSSSSCCARRCSRAGASGRTPPTSPATTRSATTPARSGRTTRRSSRPASSATASTTPRTGSSARCSRRPSASRTTGCPSCSAASTGPTPTRRCPTRSPARRRPGPPARRSCSSRRCSGLRAHADRGELELLHPHLPDWLGKVTLTDLRVGDASVDLLFHRWRGHDERRGPAQGRRRRRHDPALTTAR